MGAHTQAGDSWLTQAGLFLWLTQAGDSAKQKSMTYSAKLYAIWKSLSIATAG